MGQSKNFCGGGVSWVISFFGFTTIGGFFDVREIILNGLPGNTETAVIEGWNVEEGDEVNEGEILLELKSGSKEVLIKAPEKGILHEMYFAEGDEVELGEPLAAFEDIKYEALEEFDI